MLRVLTVLFVIVLLGAGAIYYLETMPSPKRTVTKTAPQVTTEVKAPVAPAAPTTAPAPAPQTTAAPETTKESVVVINPQPAPSQATAPVVLETTEVASPTQVEYRLPRGYDPEGSEAGDSTEVATSRYESDSGYERKSGSRMHALSREEVDARVGYVPEPEPRVAERYDDLYAAAPQTPSVVYRQRPVRQAAPACPPRYERPPYRRHARRMVRRNSCMRGQCPQQPRPYIGLKVVRPAYAVRPAYSGYGPARW